MNKVTRVISILALAIGPTLALAGPGGTTCATAEVLTAGGSFSGDTSAAGYSNVVGAFGPLPSPSNDSIYKFVASATTSGSITVTASNYNFGIFLTTNCAGTTNAPIQAATGPTVPASFPLVGLTAGQTYFVIVSGNPADSSAPNGTYNFTTPATLPVSLQKFSVQ